MTGLDVSSVAALLREFAQRSALQGDNPFRTKAYARAADNLLTLKRRDRRVKLVSLQDGKARLRTPTSGVKKVDAPREC
jgi:DNA polymerase/3'-5' exonuclease PolX